MVRLAAWPPSCSSASVCHERVPSSGSGSCRSQFLEVSYQAVCVRRMCDAPALLQIRRSGPILTPILGAQLMDPNGGRSQSLTCDSVPLQISCCNHAGATVLPSGTDSMGLVKPSRNPSWRQATLPVLGRVNCMHNWNLGTGKDFAKNRLHSPSCGVDGACWAITQDICVRSCLMHTQDVLSSAASRSGS